MEETKNSVETLEEKNKPSKAKKKVPYRRNYRKETSKKVETEKNTKKVKKSKQEKESSNEFRFKKSPIKIIPLGGLLEIGKNITVFEYENEMIIVDCGLAFPEDDMLGVDLVDKDRQEAEETFLNQARRFKGNDGVIDAEERKALGETGKELGISKARQIVLLEKVEQECSTNGVVAAPNLMPPMPTVVPRFDIFISYRRDGGGADARMMYDRLTKEGYSVSFDMDTLKNGNFNEELLSRYPHAQGLMPPLNRK